MYFGLILMFYSKPGHEHVEPRGAISLGVHIVDFEILSIFMTINFHKTFISAFDGGF